MSSDGGVIAGEAWKAHAAMVLMQFIYGGYNVITTVALSDGVNEIVFCLYRDIIAIAILAPIAYFCDIRTRPAMTRQFFFSFFLLGLTGIFGNQLLYIVGLGYTNPTYAAALQPSTPVYTFIIATMMGIETINVLRIEGLAKVGGTLVCVSGALLMVLFSGPALLGYQHHVYTQQQQMMAVGQTELPQWMFSSLAALGVDNWHLGVLCLIGSCVCSAALLAIQAPLLAKYPAYISFTAYTYFFATIFMVTTAVIMSNESTNWKLTWSEVWAVAYAGIMTSALNYGLLTWSIKILGPALVALYYSLLPVATAFLSTIFLGSPIYLGRSGSALNLIKLLPGRLKPFRKRISDEALRWKELHNLSLFVCDALYLLPRIDLSHRLPWKLCPVVCFIEGVRALRGGGLLIIVGLYLVTWARYWEKQQSAASGVSHYPSTEPLIVQVSSGPSPSVPESID
ncbi:hypothetical protein E3N88_25125 [Mikania micrantha]|uniref:EamA domain-containing protein n=1 Tax=Mikania micrantha TaxID=192012 RepID=A0A5N6N4B4_9ASTR|nr:hypothetical protein E3N88_25125 [Mikania micrantha]